MNYALYYHVNTSEIDRYLSEAEEPKMAVGMEIDGREYSYTWDEFNHMLNRYELVRKLNAHTNRNK